LRNSQIQKVNILLNSQETEEETKRKSENTLGYGIEEFNKTCGMLLKLYLEGDL
jgi:hypothetical protein